MATNNRLLRSALWYIQHDWFVVPLYEPLFTDGACAGCACEQWKQKHHPGFVCETPGKHPRLSDWEEQATNNEAVALEWWRRWPNANIGIAAGKSGLLVFDVDSYKDNYEGEQLMSRENEETVTSLTGSGGTHLIYRMPEDALYTNAKGTLPKGIDIRGWGGQFVAPPSIHPSGRRYQWEVGYGPHERTPLPLPDAICDILDSHVQQTTVVQFVEDVPPPDFENIHLRAEIVEMIHNPATKGGRSEADQSVITALCKAGASDDEIKAIFTHYPIGKQGKFHDKGANALRYLSTSISHARGWLQTCREEHAEQNAQRFFQSAVLR